MLIEIHWHDEEKTILFVKYPRRWDVDDYFQSVETSYKMLDSVPHTVHIIQDGSEMREFPTQLLRVAPQTERRAHPRRGIMIFFGLNVFIQALLKAAKYVAPNATRDMFTVSTLDQALALLARLRAERETAMPKAPQKQDVS